jgi:TetR/AcrR family transcriptional regulator, transcriptional repressor for nem operon
MGRTRSFDEAGVLRAARDQFWSAGYAAARVDDIAAATGLGKGSLYGAFGDKHQLFLRTFDDHCAGLAGQDPAVAATARRTFAAIQELISSCIAAAQRAGDSKPDADPTRLAGLLLAVLRGIEALGKGGSSPESLRAIAETALALLPVP